MMMTEAVAALQRAKRDWNAGDLERYLELYADDATLHGYAGVGPGREGIADFYRQFWSAFPGSQLDFEDLLADGDKVVCRFVLRGTHEGPFNGIPPTHRAFSVPGITILRFAAGRCAERWSQADFLSLVQQLTQPN